MGLAMLLALACGPRPADQGTTSPKSGTRPAPPGTDVEPADPAPRFAYPQTARGPVVDEYHGVKVPDPYQWLESLDAPETRAWVEAQNEVTFGYLATIPEREAIRKRLTALWDYERWGVPTRQGERYVVSRNDGLQNQAVVYTLDRLDAEPKVLLDPNALSADGTVALAGVDFSPSGNLVAYGTSASGSDWQTWRVRDVATGKDRDDVLDWIKFTGVAWTRDDKGFYYARYDAPKAGDELESLNYDQKLFYHRLGTPQRDDVLVYARPDHKEWGFSPRVTEDGKYLVVTVRVGTDPRNSVFFQKVPGGKDRGKATMIELLPDFQASWSFLGNDGPVFYFRTDHRAPRGRVVAIDTRKGLDKGLREVVPQGTDMLRSAALVGDRMFLGYLHDASSRVEIVDLAGKPQGKVELPGLGTASGFEGKRDAKETFYAYSSFADPGSIYRFDLQTGKSEVFRQPTLQFSPSDYVTEQVFFTSRDGTKVPMFVSRRKDVKPSADTPTYLYGYGGFNIALTPSFSVATLVWMEMGGLYVVANLRGGSEYGEEWHEAGTKRKKQNVFDDFIGAAEWLVEHGYTSPKKLAIGGRSNGGLLVGAAITQRPELFGAALPGVGVMDMLRFNRFTIGWAWESDYGSPANPEEFAALRAYSPYHNLKEGTAYPATLVHTADHDDRVVPGHSYKFAAALQHAHAGKAPVMIRIDTKSGHGAGKPTAKQIEEWADLWGFVVANVGMKPRLPG